MLISAPHGPADKVCPLHKQAMEEVCHKCPLWIKVVGTGPQGEVDGWDCSLAWLPVLLLENARHVIGTQAATETLRNEIVSRADAARQDRIGHRVS